MVVKERLEDRVSKKELERIANVVEMHYITIINRDSPEIVGVVITPDVVDFMVKYEGIGEPSDKEQAEEFLVNLRFLRKRLGIYNPNLKELEVRKRLIDRLEKDELVRIVNAFDMLCTMVLNENYPVIGYVASRYKVNVSDLLEFTHEVNGLGIPYGPEEALEYKKISDKFAKTR